MFKNLTAQGGKPEGGRRQNEWCEKEGARTNVPRLKPIRCCSRASPRTRPGRAGNARRWEGVLLGLQGRFSQKTTVFKLSSQGAEKYTEEEEGGRGSK